MLRKVTIYVRMSYRNTRLNWRVSIFKGRRKVLPSNLIRIDRPVENNLCSYVPCIMSLVAKMLKVQEFVLRNRLDIAFITEKWLEDTTCDSVVDISGFNIFRKDREVSQRYGSCIYLKQGVMNNIFENLPSCDARDTTTPTNLVALRFYGLQISLLGMVSSSGTGLLFATTAIVNICPPVSRKLLSLAGTSSCLISPYVYAQRMPLGCLLNSKI